MRPSAIILLFSVFEPDFYAGEEIEDRSFYYAKKPAPDKSNTYEAEARTDSKERPSDDYVHKVIYYIDCHTFSPLSLCGSRLVACRPKHICIKTGNRPRHRRRPDLRNRPQHGCARQEAYHQTASECCLNHMQSHGCR